LGSRPNLTQLEQAPATAVCSPMMKVGPDHLAQNPGLIIDIRLGDGKNLRLRRFAAGNRLQTQPVVSGQDAVFQSLIIIQGGPVMLVIPRKQDQSVVIGENIVLTVIEVRGDKVRLGIEHPDGVTVHRREVYEAILNWNVNQNTKPSSSLHRDGDP
jgi:carbon storage regulator